MDKCLWGIEAKRAVPPQEELNVLMRHGRFNLSQDEGHARPTKNSQPQNKNLLEHDN